MTKQSNQGKKRRSKWNAESIALQSKTADAYEQGMMPIFFCLMLNEFKKGDLTIQDEMLRKDVKQVIDILYRLSERDRKKGGNQFFHGYPQKDIQVLNTILRRVPIFIGVNFDIYTGLDMRTNELKKRKERIDVSKVFDEMRWFIKSLDRKEKITKIRFWSYAPTEANYFERLGDKEMRYLLSSGLFYLLQGLILNEPIKVKACSKCDSLFIFSRSSKEFCSTLCRTRAWNTSSIGRIRCKNKSRKWREKQQKGLTLK